MGVRGSALHVVKNPRIIYNQPPVSMVPLFPQSPSTDSTNLGLKFSPWLVESMDAKQTVDTDGVTVFIGKNKTVYK